MDINCSFVQCFIVTVAINAIARSHLNGTISVTGVDKGNTFDFNVFYTVSLPRVARSYAVVGFRPTALQRVPAVDDAFTGDGKLTDPVIFLFDARVRHAGHPGPLLRQAQLVGTVFRYAVGPQLQLHRTFAAGRPDALRSAVMRAPVP